MGNWWLTVPPPNYLEAGSIDVDHIPRLCTEMHARYVSWAHTEHWSVVAWYRKLYPDGTVDPQVTMLASPACVIPTDSQEYRLLDEQGVEMHSLDAQEVAEFEDTFYHVSTLSSAWSEVLQRMRQ